LKTRISSDNQRCISVEHTMLLPSESTPPVGKDILILTNLGKTLIGKWGKDCVAWFPMPATPTIIK
jgi:hypothetical protein